MKFWGNGSERYLVKILSEINLIRAKYAIADIVQVGSEICSSDRGVVTHPGPLIGQ